MSGVSTTDRGRREFSRVRVNAPANVVAGGQPLDTTMVDISISGARVRHPGPLFPGQTIVVEWAGQRAMGRVVWFEDGRCGLNFFDHLEAKALLAARDASVEAGKTAAPRISPTAA